MFRALERRRDEFHRVEHRRVATGSKRIERARHSLVIARPRHRQPHLVGESGEEHFVARIEALDEQLERPPRIGPPRIVERARSSRSVAMLPLMSSRMPRLTGTRSVLNCVISRRVAVGQLESAAVRPVTKWPDRSVTVTGTTTTVESERKTGRPCA